MGLELRNTLSECLELREDAGKRRIRWVLRHGGNRDADVDRVLDWGISNQKTGHPFKKSGKTTGLDDVQWLGSYSGRLVCD